MVGRKEENTKTRFARYEDTLIRLDKKEEKNIVVRMLSLKKTTLQRHTMGSSVKDKIQSFFSVLKKINNINASSKTSIYFVTNKHCMGHLPLRHFWYNNMCWLQIYNLYEILRRHRHKINVTGIPLHFLLGLRVMEDPSFNFVLCIKLF